MTILLGADPEVFWRNEKNVVSVIGKLGGSKLEARQVAEDLFVLEDNVAAEFNFSPCDSAEKYINSIGRSLAFLEQEASKFGAQLARGISSASFPVEELNDPMAFVFGCEPDFNAWTGTVNAPPTSDDPTLRSCGGHVHIGGIPKRMDKNNLVRCLDLFLGIPSVFQDNDIKRRELYGKAGACRPKPYGVEYRTLSNYWIFDPKLIQFVYDQSHKAIEFAQKNVMEPDSEIGKLIQIAINRGDKEAAQSVLEKVNVYAA